jgi:DNA-binding response OmpR family regulator
MAGRILVVEDDPRIAASVALYLRHGGYEVDVATTGSAALDRAAASRPDLVVLDLMIPEVDGVTVCRTLRAHAPIPIIMLTARSTEADRLRGLEAGADDYVTKPFSPRELVLRVAAVLRRSRPPAGVVRVADVEIDLTLRQVRRLGRVVAMTASEFGLLEALASVPGRTFTRTELAERAFGPAYEGLERTIDVHVKNLRRKLNPDRADRTSTIATVFGTGYRLEVPVRAD